MFSSIGTNGNINNRKRVIKSDLANLNGQIQIDDGNSPAPENILSSEDNGTNEIFSSRWGHDGVFCCRQAGGHNTEAKLLMLVALLVYLH